MSIQCQALNISDENRCEATATSSNGLFCPFHARQCFGLYKGYKRRNAELDHLVAHPVPLLRGISLHELQLAQEDNEEVLEDCHKYLLRRFFLLERVVRARRLHTSRFYALNLDYGHENYVNQLSAQRTPLLRAIENVVKRLAEVMYKKHHWFEWIRKLEADEEKEREVEKKKVKQEAALFKRHNKEVEARLKQLKAEEDAKRQEEYLQTSWEEARQASDKLNEDSIDDSWDPIEDNIEDERGNYIDLLKHFLWQYKIKEGQAADVDGSEANQNGEMKNGASAQSQEDHEQTEDNVEASTSTSKSKNAKKRARQKANAKSNTPADARPEAKEQLKPGTIHVESMSELRERLRVGQEFRGGGRWVSKGMNGNPEESETRSPPLRPDEIEKAIGDIAEIKQLLFCRIVLGHAALLPIALRSNSIDEFLADEEIVNSDLRDLCLKMEQPGLQELRDACADLKREDEAMENEDEANVTVTNESLAEPRMSLVRSKIPDTLQTKRERSIKSKRNPTNSASGSRYVNFGHIDDQDQYQAERVKIKVCGRNIYNYPSEKALPRGGWFQFSIIAKDCDLEDAVSLCRNWDEFYELVVLTMHNYFPASGWANFLGTPDMQQLFKLGFFPFFRMDLAEKFTHHYQSGRNRGTPRQHNMMETRNFVCGQMKRNDPVSRRFIQYIAMQSCDLVMLVRDVQTGSVLVQPPSDELWLTRQKVGVGRANKYEWENLQSVDQEFFEVIDKYRRWSLNFKEYYEILIWSFEAGDPFPVLFNAVQTALFKAHRVHSGAEIHKPAEAILKSITMDKDTSRAYDLEPGDGKLSMWEILNDPRTKFFSIKRGPDVEDGESYGDLYKEWLYSEADRLEDEVLFPWESTLSDQQQNGNKALFESSEINGVNKKGDGNAFLSTQDGDLYTFENRGPDMARFIMDLDTDEELDEKGNAELTRLRRQLKKDASESEDSEEETSSEPSQTDGESATDSEDIDWLESLSERESKALGEMMRAYQSWQGLDLDSDSDDDEEMPMNINKRRQVNQALSKKQTKKPAPQMEIYEDDRTQADFNLFVDREKAAIFKTHFHKADLEPNADARWTEYRSLMSALFEWATGDGLPKVKFYKDMAFTFGLLEALDVDENCHRKVEKDARLARLLVSFFFKGVGTDFLLSAEGAQYNGSLLFDQVERAKNIPDRRSSMSNKTRPKEHFVQRDQQLKDRSPMPEQWALTTRPKIAWLFRAGVITPKYSSGGAGRAICLSEPDRPDKPDLFFDYRRHMAEFRVPNLSSVLNIEPLLEQARGFTKTNVLARFSVLKVWSAPHFWPLMLGYHNRDFNSFVDDRDRTWEWKFVPKDMPGSEWSMHKTVSDRLAEYKCFDDRRQMQGSEVVSRIDTILIKATDTETCRFLTEAVTFAINTRSWRLEIDPWKSWFNVDLKFLEALDNKWWE